MAKYIRTKDGIYKIALTDKIRFGQYYCYKVDRQNINQYSIIAETSILKQADTIEELCDGFVTVGNKHIVWDKQHCLGLTFEQVKESYSTYHFKIYGAIWTDEGLIYVAKMNDKGELELCPN